MIGERDGAEDVGGETLLSVLVLAGLLPEGRSERTRLLGHDGGCSTRRARAARLFLRAWCMGLALGPFLSAGCGRDDCGRWEAFEVDPRLRTSAFPIAAGLDGVLGEIRDRSTPA